MDMTMSTPTLTIMMLLAIRKILLFQWVVLVQPLCSGSQIKLTIMDR